MVIGFLLILIDNIIIKQANNMGNLKYSYPIFNFKFVIMATKKRYVKTWLAEACNKVYENKGQGGVFDFINQYFLKEVDFKLCKPCETDSPVEKGTSVCLVCGSEIL